MGVFKEEASTFETLAKKQTRIYSDAFDYGYPYNTNNVPLEVTAVFDTIKRLKALDKQYPIEKPIVRNRMEWKEGVSVDVIIFWEEDEGYYVGTKYHIMFNKSGKYASKIDKNFNAYVSIDIERYKEKV